MAKKTDSKTYHEQLTLLTHGLRVCCQRAMGAEGMLKQSYLAGADDACQEMHDLLQAAVDGKGYDLK